MSAPVRKSSRAGRGNLMASLLATEELGKPVEDAFWGGDGKGAELWGKVEKGQYYFCFYN